jgi:hypothetical protein
MKTETKYNKVVNISEDGEITLLSYVFECKDFKGATGDRFYPVSREEYEDRTNDESVIDYLESAGCDYIQIKDTLDNYSVEEQAEFMFDMSYSELWDYLREVTGLSEEDYHIFECVGGGRCFDKDFQGNVNPELSEIIRQYES